MRVIRVVVDKLPDDWLCFECGFIFINDDGDEACAAIQNFDNEETGRIDSNSLRPNWCPLVTVKQCRELLNSKYHVGSEDYITLDYLMKESEE